MSKRDILEEILAKKERTGYRELRAAAGLLKISDDLTHQMVASGIGISLQLVGIVACIEVACRDALSKLIDSGTPYVERVSELLKGEIRFTVEVIRAFEDKKISLGEFVTHLLPISNLAQINGYFDTLLGGSFRDTLSSIRGYPPHERATRRDLEGENELPLLVPDVDLMMVTLARAFAARHVVAHEAVFDSVSEQELREFLALAIVFDTAFEYIRQSTDASTLWPVVADSAAAVTDATRTQDDMHSTYDRLFEILGDGYVESARPDTAELLATAQVSFERYADDEVAFQLAFRSPISGHAMRNVEACVTKRLAASRRETLVEALNDSFSWLGHVRLRGGGA